VRQPLAPRPRPVEDFCQPSDFATSPEDAWELADLELEEEEAKAAEDA
jgi:hypothetical protein